MIKQLLYMVGLTILAVLSLPYIHSVLNQLIALHSYTLDHLNQVFANGNIAHYIQQIIAIAIIPIGVGLIIAGGEWVIKRRVYPQVLLLIAWAIWLMLVTVLAIK